MGGKREMAGEERDGLEAWALRQGLGMGFEAWA